MMTITIRAAVCLALFGFYLVLAGDCSPVEAGSAFVAALSGTLLVASLAAKAEQPFECRPPRRVLLRPLAALVPQALRVGRVLLAAGIGRPPLGEKGFFRQPFAHGDRSDAAAGRRAAVVLAISFAPQTFVVREEEGLLLLHGLPPKALAPDRAWPL